MPLTHDHQNIWLSGYRVLELSYQTVIFYFVGGVSVEGKLTSCLTRRHSISLRQKNSFKKFQESNDF
jgi:hypothetical protein